MPIVLIVAGILLYLAGLPLVGLATLVAGVIWTAYLPDGPISPLENYWKWQDQKDYEEAIGVVSQIVTRRDLM